MRLHLEGHRAARLVRVCMQSIRHALPHLCSGLSASGGVWCVGCRGRGETDARELIRKYSPLDTRREHWD